MFQQKSWMFSNAFISWTMYQTTKIYGYTRYTIHVWHCTHTHTHTQKKKYIQDWIIMPNNLTIVFVSKIKDVNVHEGQPAHFDCRIEPIGDGSMQVRVQEQYQIN